MDEIQLLEKYGLPPKPECRNELIELLNQEIVKEQKGNGDIDILSCLALLLFSIGKVEDSLQIWRVKSLSFDLMCAINIQFLCGAGLEDTLTFLESQTSDEALYALDYLNDCVEGCDFDDWSPESFLKGYQEYYEIYGKT